MRGSVFHKLAFEEMAESGAKRVCMVFVRHERIEFLAHVRAGRSRF